MSDPSDDRLAALINERTSNLRANRVDVVVRESDTDGLVRVDNLLNMLVAAYHLGQQGDPDFKDKLSHAASEGVVAAALNSKKRADAIFAAGIEHSIQCLEAENGIFPVGGGMS